MASSSSSTAAAAAPAPIVSSYLQLIESIPPEKLELLSKMTLQEQYATGSPIVLLNGLRMKRDNPIVRYTLLLQQQKQKQQQQK
jgi:hypothetical protein